MCIRRVFQIIPKTNAPGCYEAAKTRQQYLMNMDQFEFQSAAEIAFLPRLTYYNRLFECFLIRDKKKNADHRPIDRFDLDSFSVQFDFDTIYTISMDHRPMGNLPFFNAKYAKEENLMRFFFLSCVKDPNGTINTAAEV